VRQFHALLQPKLLVQIPAMNETELLARISYNPIIFGGKAIIRGTAAGR